jgi:hypothetical protein
MYAVLLVFVIISVSVIAISKNKSLRNHTSARGQPIEVHHSARPPNSNPRVPIWEITFVTRGAPDQDYCSSQSVEVPSKNRMSQDSLEML